MIGVSFRYISVFFFVLTLILCVWPARDSGATTAISPEAATLEGSQNQPLEGPGAQDEAAAPADPLKSWTPPPGLQARTRAAQTLPHGLDGWVLPAQTGESVRLALTLRAGTEPDRLLKVTTGWADSASLILSSRDLDGSNPITRQVTRLRLEPGSRVVFRGESDQGFGLLLRELRRELRAGQTFPVTLHFEKAGPITVSVQVRPPPGSS